MAAILRVCTYSGVVFHRDVRHSTDLCPANRLCQIGRSPRRRGRRDVHTRHATARGRVAVCVTVFTAALTGCSSDPSPAPGATSVAADGAVTVSVVMKDMRFEPSVIEVEPGTHVIIEAKNADSMPHDLVFENDLSTDLLPRDKSATLDLGVIEANLDGWCSVSGHRAAGMTLTIEVTGGE
ncbi:cupredoxin domain-containing protein [Sanguibacter gelidistatuariae]|uniref:cupredoxin domain-containing protein n=1 Tax=Sanguibacter gelidistatuariae TaxID=1814289 RepID=UPI000B80A417|nr:cupredoxin domain-containing protein [Sanguibacter gelidistatuariae]